MAADGILKISVLTAEFSPGTLRWAARSAAGPDPEAGNRYLRYPHRADHRAIYRVHAEGRRDEHRAQRRVRLHGGDADPYQIQNAAAARSGARKINSGR